MGGRGLLLVQITQPTLAQHEVGRLVEHRKDARQGHVLEVHYDHGKGRLADREAPRLADLDIARLEDQHIALLEGRPPPVQRFVAAPPPRRLVATHPQ
jgi:hypothetical protein